MTKKQNNIIIGILIIAGFIFIANNLFPFSFISAQDHEIDFNRVLDNIPASESYVMTWSRENVGELGGYNNGAVIIIEGSFTKLKLPNVDTSNDIFLQRFEEQMIESLSVAFPTVFNHPNPVSGTLFPTSVSGTCSISQDELTGDGERKTIVSCHPIIELICQPPPNANNCQASAPGECCVITAPQTGSINIEFIKEGFECTSSQMTLCNNMNPPTENGEWTCSNNQCSWDEDTVPSDVDNDGILDMEDNCPFDYNPNQSDSDGDGIGDVCDELPEEPELESDTDNDGIIDSEDNCPEIYNPNQSDIDGDNIGDVCDQDPEEPEEEVGIGILILATVVLGLFIFFLATRLRRKR